MATPAAGDTEHSYKAIPLWPRSLRGAADKGMADGSGFGVHKSGFTLDPYLSLHPSTHQEIRTLLRSIMEELPRHLCVINAPGVANPPKVVPCSLLAFFHLDFAQQELASIDEQPTACIAGKHTRMTIHP